MVFRLDWNECKRSYANPLDYFTVCNKTQCVCLHLHKSHHISRVIAFKVQCKRVEINGIENYKNYSSPITFCIDNLVICFVFTNKRKREQ